MHCLGVLHLPLGINMTMSILGKKQFTCEHDDAMGSENGIVDGSRYCLLLNDEVCSLRRKASKLL